MSPDAFPASAVHVYFQMLLQLMPRGRRLLCHAAQRSSWKALGFCLRHLRLSAAELDTGPTSAGEGKRVCSRESRGHNAEGDADTSEPLPLWLRPPPTKLKPADFEALQPLLQVARIQSGGRLHPWLWPMEEFCNILLAKCAEHGSAAHVAEATTYMNAAGVWPRSSTITALVSACCRRRAFGRARDLLNELEAMDDALSDEAAGVLIGLIDELPAASPDLNMTFNADGTAPSRSDPRAPCRFDPVSDLHHNCEQEAAKTHGTHRDPPSTDSSLAEATAFLEQAHRLARRSQRPQVCYAAERAHLRVYGRALQPQPDLPTLLRPPAAPGAFRPSVPERQWEMRRRSGLPLDFDLATALLRVYTAPGRSQQDHEDACRQVDLLLQAMQRDQLGLNAQLFNLLVQFYLQTDRLFRAERLWVMFVGPLDGSAGGDVDAAETVSPEP